jgi:regulatory protein YycH of two-component signal transduction system YycFG
MAKVISMEELNKLIDSQEDKGDKKALLIVKSNLRRYKGTISKNDLENIVEARKKGEEAAGEIYIANEMEELFEESNNTVKHLNNVTYLVFGPDEDD